jgi:hypothetical protein
MSTPSIVVINWGKALNLASTLRQSLRRIRDQFARRPLRRGNPTM